MSNFLKEHIEAFKEGKTEIENKRESDPRTRQQYRMDANKESIKSFFLM